MRLARRTILGLETESLPSFSLLKSVSFGLWIFCLQRREKERGARGEKTEKKGKSQTAEEGRKLWRTEMGRWKKCENVACFERPFYITFFFFLLGDRAILWILFFLEFFMTYHHATNQLKLIYHSLDSGADTTTIPTTTFSSINNLNKKKIPGHGPKGSTKWFKLASKSSLIQA